jgi:cytochrome c biogenesis protein CcdA/thiol-disulfide isomerase/thioredoxin
MLLFILAYLGGVLTIVSPCILPVLPFVFSRADQPFLRSGLPMLVGMAVTFALVASLAAVGGGWVVAANDYGRLAALVLMALFGIALLLPGLSDRLTRPLVALGARLSQSAEPGYGAGRAPLLSSLLLGVATGLLWAPCAGPVLGLILTGAALRGASVGTSLLLIAYAAGAATSLALALLVGGRVFAAMKRSLHVGEWVRRGLGAAVIVAVVAIALGLDTNFLTRVSLASTVPLEQNLLDKLHVSNNAPTQSSDLLTNGPTMMPGNPATMMSATPLAASEKLPVEDVDPSFSGATEWLNSPALTADGLKGKVVLVDFWTYSCINCLRTVPYIRAWAEKYKDQGLVVIGVHTPEFAFEQKAANVKRAIADLHITYPVAIDNDYTIWRAFENEYWPAHYFIDVQGRVRYQHFGEGDYDHSEHVIQQLLAEAGRTNVSTGVVTVSAFGAEAASHNSDVRSPETYVGYRRAQNFSSPGGIVNDAAHVYADGASGLNEWSLSGDWTVGGEHAELDTKDGGIIYRFHARDLHLVLGPSSGGQPIRFRVTIDGKPPGDNHGTDVDAAGDGKVTEQRLYQLVRQTGPITDRTFEIRFLDPGVQAFAFTFG